MGLSGYPPRFILTPIVYCFRLAVMGLGMFVFFACRRCLLHSPTLSHEERVDAWTRAGRVRAGRGSPHEAVTGRGCRLAGPRASTVRHGHFPHTRDAEALRQRLARARAHLEHGSLKRTRLARVLQSFQAHRWSELASTRCHRRIRKMLPTCRQPAQWTIDRRDLTRVWHTSHTSLHSATRHIHIVRFNTTPNASTSSPS